VPGEAADQQRLAHGPLAEYPNDDFGAEVPRSGNASGGGQPGWAVRCAPGGPNDYVYVIVQPVGCRPITGLIGRPELADDPGWATPEARLPRLNKMFQLIEEWSSTLPGSVPFVFLFTSDMDLRNYRTVLACVGVGLCLVVAAAGWFFKDPPKNWWPAHIDPLKVTEDPKIRRTLEKNPPAVKQYTPREAARTPVLWMMWFCLLCAAGINKIWAGDVRSEWLFLFFAFLSSFGGGAFYPLFAALTPD
jgi:hypothetical protein